MCALIVAVAMVSVGVTLAAGKPNFETNVVVIGEIKIGLIDEYYEIQPDYVSSEDSDKHYTEDNPPVFSPDTTVKKNISVENIGRYPCYVRLLVKRIWSKGSTDLSGYITIPYDEDNWYKGDDIDGFECYYYKNILGVGERAPDLCHNFKLGKFNVSQVGGTMGDIKVYAQGVQSDYTDIQTLANGTDAEIAASTGTIVKNPDGMIVKWNGLVFN